MKALLIYLLVTSVCTGVFYGCFRLLMWKETCFAFNRATLLLIVILPLTIPFLPSPAGGAGPARRFRKRRSRLV